MIRKLLGLVVLIVVAGAVAFWWFYLRSTPTKTLSLNSGGTTLPISDKGKQVDVDGTWTVQSSDRTKAGLRINEKFIGGLAEHTAVGRTSVVNGTMAIAGTKVTSASFVADLEDIVFTDSPGGGLNVANRKQAIQHSGLELSTFPTGSFKLTRPIDLGSVPRAGTAITVPATGDLTLHGTTRQVTFNVQAEIENGDIVVASARPVPVKLADYGMSPPTFGPVADVSGSGFFEFELLLAKA